MTMDMNRILVVTDLLLGAAYADGRLVSKEAFRVRKILRMIIADDSVLNQIEKRIASFDPKQFDLKAVAAQFAPCPVITKRSLLEFVSAVSIADEEIDLAEDEYLCALAKAMGMTEDQFSDLKLDYKVEVLQDRFHVVIEVIELPPPVPTKVGTR